MQASHVRPGSRGRDIPPLPYAARPARHVTPPPAVVRGGLRAACRRLAADLNPLRRTDTFGTTVALVVAVLAVPASQYAAVL